MRQFLNEQVNDRLKNALGGPDSYVSVTGGSTTSDEQQAESNSTPSQSSSPDTTSADGRRGDVTTSKEELEGFHIVRAIVCSEVPAARIVARDTKTYFGVLLDDNNRKPIARLWLNRSKKYLGIFDEHKAETRIPIMAVEDIYHHADHLRKTVSRYLSDAAIANAPVQADHPAHTEP
jgi:hypothetical protein